MKMTYLIVGILLMCGVVFYFTRCRNNSTVKNHKTRENAFDGLRDMAFSLTPVQLGVSFPDDKTIVYGIVMDWGMNSAVVTTVCYQTGDASLYLSSGGGIIGGGGHQAVNSAAKQFVSLAQTYLDKATKTETTDLPATDEIKFYLLTNKGVFAGEEQMKNFENETSKWLPLFEEGNKVITELRLTKGSFDGSL